VAAPFTLEFDRVLLAPAANLVRVLLHRRGGGDAVSQHLPHGASNAISPPAVAVAPRARGTARCRRCVLLVPSGRDELRHRRSGAKCAGSYL
jgi:hypothetical protein